MPNYKYQCPECGHAFTDLQGINEKPHTDCPSCGKPSLKRMIGRGTGVIYKGSGFYSTDYKGKKSEAKTDKEPVCAGCASAKDNGGACPAK